MRACGRNDFSDATQPISLVDYAEIIDLHSWFQPPTTRALVTGNGHAWSRVNHGSYRGHGTAGWPSPRSPETEVDPARQRKSFGNGLSPRLKGRCCRSAPAASLLICRSLSRRRRRWRRSGVARQQRQAIEHTVNEL